MSALSAAAVNNGPVKSVQHFANAIDNFANTIDSGPVNTNHNQHDHDFKLKSANYHARLPEAVRWKLDAGN